MAQLKWSLVMLKKTFHTQTSSDQHIFKKKMEKNAHEYFVGHIKWCKQTDQIDVTWHNMHTPYHIYEMMDERREKFHIDFLCTRHSNRVCRYNQSNGNKVLRIRTHIWRKKVWRARERIAAAVPEKKPLPQCSANMICSISTYKSSLIYRFTQAVICESKWKFDYIHNMRDGGHSIRFEAHKYTKCRFIKWNERFESLTV